MSDDIASEDCRGGRLPENKISKREFAFAAQGALHLRVLGIVLAGGKGTRLFPLTRERAKPAVPFGGKYRIIDFVLSNFINSGIHSIYVLTQFRSQSLLQHLSEGWQFGRHRCARRTNPGTRERPTPSSRT
jgi:ADP-glucose pyrophosphorylase